MTTNDKHHIESAIAFIDQARQENITAMHATSRIITAEGRDAFKANCNAAAMWEAASRELKTYLGGWHALPRFQRERESA
jgi:hypothetical protein